MSRPLLRLATLCRNVSKLRPFAPLASPNRSSCTILRKTVKSLCFLTASCLKTIEIEEEIPVFLEEHILKPSHQIEKDLIQLMLFLKSGMLNACEQYVDCLIHQIEITKESAELGPIGAHWDQLTEFRVKANELKSTLIRYQVLLKRMEQIVVKNVDNPAACHVNTIKPELERLKEAFLAQLCEIQKYENELLCINRDCIMYCNPQ